uniref:Uncharacterized protein n=1 Tax=Sinocyclocheilus rhinocerous TaxID=307959 RepID=A0A673MXL2_9TELE
MISPCVLRLTCDHLYFVLSGRVATGGVSMWCELSQGNFFDEFQLEGVSADTSEIFLEVAPENLSRALKMKSCPCLTLAAELVRTAVYFDLLFEKNFNVIENHKKVFLYHFAQLMFQSIFIEHPIKPNNSVPHVKVKLS